MPDSPFCGATAAIWISVCCDGFRQHLPAARVLLTRGPVWGDRYSPEALARPLPDYSMPRLGLILSLTLACGAGGGRDAASGDGLAQFTGRWSGRLTILTSGV